MEEAHRAAFAAATADLAKFDKDPKAGEHEAIGVANVAAE